MPQVIATFPRLEDGTPFPTTWWLTCKLLAKEVSRLESTGYMVGINDDLSAGTSMTNQLQQSTAEYLKYRDSLAILEERVHPGGSAGHVKCLHAHVAHHLVKGGNPIGERVLGSLDWHDPEIYCI